MNKRKFYKITLLVVGVILLTTTSAYAAYKIATFNDTPVSLAGLKNNIDNLTDGLTQTTSDLKSEKDAHALDVSTANAEIGKANAYASSVSSAVSDANSTNAAASSAMSAASSAASYDPSTTASSAQ